MKQYNRNRTYRINYAVTDDAELQGDDLLCGFCHSLLFVPFPPNLLDTTSGPKFCPSFCPPLASGMASLVVHV